MAHFDRVFYQGLSGRNRQDLIEYLQAIGDGEQALLPDDLSAHLKEIVDSATVLDTALCQHNQVVATLTLGTLDRELRDLAEAFPERRNPAVNGGVVERVRARAALKGLVLALHEVDTEVGKGRFDNDVVDLARYRNTLADALPQLRSAQTWSLFNSQVHAAQFAAVRKLFRTGADPALTPARRADTD